MEKRITTPLSIEEARKLKAGEQVLISGTLYVARDAAHKRMVEALVRGDSLPFDIRDTIIYYMGPTPPKTGKAIGSAGPTTSYRMDSYTPKLISIGLRGMIGKGPRSKEVVDCMVKSAAVYFAAIGGAAALISKNIIKSEVIAYEDLGSEAIMRIEVVDLPVVVAIDCYGNNWYELGQAEYKASTNK